MNGIGSAGWQTQNLACSTSEGGCGHLWQAQTPTNVPIDAFVGFIGALRCPACGSKKAVSFSGMPPREVMATERAADSRFWSDEQRRQAFLRSSDVGLSSKAIADQMAGWSSPHLSCTPADADDLARCLRLLQRFPTWTIRMPEMGMVTMAWKCLVSGDRWQQLTDSMEREAGSDWSKSDSAPETAALLRRFLGSPVGQE